MTHDTTRNESSESENSNVNELDSTEQRDTFETLHPALRLGIQFVIKSLWVVSRLVVVGGMVAFSFLTDRERRIHARRWLLLESDRWLIVGGLVGGVFLVTFGLSLTGTFGIERSDFVTNVFTTVIAGLFSFVPIIIAVNQLTISQLFGTPESLREQIADIAEFRASIEKRIPDIAVSPTDPGEFASVANGVLSEQAAQLERACADRGDGSLEERIENYTEEIITETTQLDTRLDGERLRLIEVLLPMMGNGYSENINEARRIQHEYADVLSACADELLDDLREMFVSMDVIRQYFKALYIKQELARLSRLIAYTGISAFLVSLFLILLFANGVPPGGYGVGMMLLVSAGLAAASLPFAVFFAFIIRIATIAKRTAAPGAFTPRGETPDYLQDRQ